MLELKTAIDTYLRFYYAGSVSDERSEAHEEMMWQMRLAGIAFTDREHAREIAIEIIHWFDCFCNTSVIPA